MSGQRYIHLFTEPPRKESDWENVEHDLQEALETNIQRVQRQIAVADGTRESVYLGDAGIAMMEILLAERIGHRSSGQEGQTQHPLSYASLTSLADHHLAPIFRESDLNAKSIRDGGHISFLETPLGIATLVLSRYPIGRQRSFAGSLWARSRDYLLRALEIVHRDDLEDLEGDDACEVLYGRAGFLYALLYLRNMGGLSKEPEDLQGTEEDAGAKQDLESLKRSILSDHALGRVVRSIIRRGRNGAKSYLLETGGNLSKSPSLMWTWHNKRYLGGAHGVAGILQMLLRCPTAIISEHMPEIVQTIDWLVCCQDRAGNWPTSAPDMTRTTPSDHELVQWCHGAPAMLTLLSTILRMSVAPEIRTGLTEKQQQRFVTSLQRGCALVYMHGLLRKGVGLCHGIAGSVYALLAASDLLDDPQVAAPASTKRESSSGPLPNRHAPYFTQATHLAHLATRVGDLTKKGEMRTPDRPWSLYGGMAGICCAWGEILYRMRNGVKACGYSGMPGYDDLTVQD